MHINPQIRTLQEPPSKSIQGNIQNQMEREIHQNENRQAQQQKTRSDLKTTL